MEPILCTELVPFEMWEMILDHVVHMEDLVNCQRTCRHWERILENKVQLLLLFHKMFPILGNYLDLRDTLLCRLVCHGWREAVDDSRHFWPANQWSAYYERKFGYSNLSLPERWLANPDYCQNAEHFSLDSGKILTAGAAETPEFSIQFPGLRILSPTLARSLVFQLEIGEFAEWKTESGEEEAEEADLMVFRCSLTKYVNHHILCDSANNRKTKISYLTTPFTTFPKLKVLLLTLRYGKRTRGSLEGLETEVLEVVGGLKKGHRIRLDNLTGLSVYIEKMGFEECREKERNMMMLPLARWISALVTSAPRLEKVTLSLGAPPEFCSLEEIEELDRLLRAIATATTVKTLTLENWNEGFNLSGLGQKSGLYWPLTSLRIDFDFGGFIQNKARIPVPSILRLYFDILQIFGKSLEELEIQTLRLVCCERGCSNQSRVIGQLERKCFCNCYYDKYENPEEEEVPDIRIRSGGGETTATTAVAVLPVTFEKLELLSISHALLHPAIFRAVMKANPALVVLRINDLGWKDWIGKDSPDGFQVVAQGLGVSQLWAEAPPSLKLIVVDNPRLRSHVSEEYRYTRNMFKDSPPPPLERRRNKKCVIS